MCCRGQGVSEGEWRLERDDHPHVDDKLSVVLARLLDLEHNDDPLMEPEARLQTLWRERT